ncbi:nucleolar protein 58 [Nematocida displodere]|uniref:Nucleolar protein 58 n=1 Tax=Nematocida displodere TaxID=1805483 RepID=A0A177ECQ1_9MICR|nr:nucleolar protein 58 [Nematocida displodere]
MHVLHETPIGYALFKSSPLELEELKRFASSKEAVEVFVLASSGSVPENLIEMLAGKGISLLGISNGKIAEEVEAQLKARGETVKVQTGEAVEETSREIQKRLPELLSIKARDLGRSSLLLAHALAREKLNMSAQQLDLVVVQSIGVLDKLDKDINNKSMRIREWYGMHFPELGEMIPDNFRYLRVLRKQLSKDGDESYDDINNENEEEIKEAMKKTIGGEIDTEDESILKDTVDSVLQMYATRESLQAHLYNRMEQIAPNLLELVGDHMGARLIAHAGSLAELARKPASTIQVMGAEKALFKAMKEKGNTPKYGYIFNSTYVGQAPLELKGQVARTLAAKIALASRCDAYDEEEDSERGSFGRKAREDVEKRVKALTQKKKTAKKIEPRSTSKFAVKRPSPASHSPSSFKKHRSG